MNAIETQIDKAMHSASKTYERYKLQGDPYAMHKAVENIPIKVLCAMRQVIAKPMREGDLS